jgi:3-oxoacid CoA-transferase subunit A
MNRVRASALEALSGIRDGASIAAGGFGLCGIPELCIRALREIGVRDLTIASNNCGVDDFGLGLLLANRQIRKMISSYVGENKEFERQALAGELELELVPQGTLAERLRAGGAGIARSTLPREPARASRKTRKYANSQAARNFNPLCAMAGRIAVAEVEELLDVGTMPPDHIHTPGVYVQHVVVGPHEKRIERRTVRANNLV